MGKNQRFHNSDEYYIQRAALSLNKAVDLQKITKRDRDLITEFINEIVATSQVSATRQHKVTSLLIRNRAYLPEYSACTITDVYNAIGNIKSAKNERGELRYSRNTVSDMVREIKRFFLWLSENGYTDIDSRKLHKIKLPAAPSITVTPDKILTEDEVLSIIQACTTSRDRALVSVLYEGGFRIGEIGNLTWGDVTFKSWNATARTAEKTGKERFVPLVSSRSYLIQWKEDYPLPITPDAFVFLTTTTHKPLQYAGVVKQLRIISNRAGVTKHIKPHIFRHSRITHMINNGMPESHVKMIMWGDVSSEMLRNYLHLNQDDIAAKVAEMNGISAEGEEEPKKKRGVKPQQCKVCAAINTPTAVYCSNCGTPLSEEGKVRMDSIEDRIRNEMLSNPEFMLMLASAMKNLEQERLQVSNDV